MDGSRRISLRNRQFLRKFTPIQHPLSSHTYKEQPQEIEEQMPPITPYPDLSNPVYNGQPNNPGEPTGSEDDSELPRLLYPVSATQQANQEDTCPDPEENSPVGGGGSVGVGVGATSPPRRSIRSTRGQTARFNDFVTGNQFEDVTNELSFIPYVPTGYGSAITSSGCQPLPYLYQPPVGYELVSYMWNRPRWEVSPVMNYV